MTAGIYKIINKINKKYYVGSSQNIEHRWIIHRSHLNTQEHINIFLQRAWNKYGADNFEIQIIENCDGYTRDQIFMVEQKYLNSLDNMTYNLSRLAKGGDNLTHHPDRDNIIARMTASVIARYSSMSDEDWDSFSKSKMGEKNGMFGKTHTEESRQAISENNKKFYSENDNYIEGKTFEEVFGKEEAQRRKTILSEAASQRVGDKNPFYGKEHTEETRQVISEKRLGNYSGTQNNPVSINGKYYRSVGVASKELNILPATIRWRVLSKNKKFVNYQYAKEE